MSIQRFQGGIHEIRGQRVILDADLARAYGVSTKALNQAVKRNRARFPRGFCFRLTQTEAAHLRSQTVTSSAEWGGRRTPPLAFNEHGAVMAASVLNSPRAVQMSVFVVRAFLRLRQLALSHTDLSRRLDDLEKTYDARFKVLFDAIRSLMVPSARASRRIGFTTAGMARRP